MKAFIKITLLIVFLCFFSFFFIFYFYPKQEVKAQIYQELKSYTINSETTCSGGTCTTIYYPNREFYKENNTWNRINTTFYFNGTHWIADGNNFKVYVRDNIITIKGEDESSVYFKVPTSNPPSVSGNIITYDISTKGSIKVNALLNIMVTSESVEKLIIVSSITTNQNSWKYSEEYNDTFSKSKFLLGEPKIWYVANNTTDSWIVDYPITWIKSGNSLEIYINKSWFDSATYPIYIDPTVIYNFTVVNGNKAYGDSADGNGGTVTVKDGTGDFSDEPNPTFTEVFTRTVSNFTQNGYSALSTLNNGCANITSPGSNNEPFGKYNFTISQPSTTINWLNVTMSQKEIVNTGSTEHCYYGIVNFTNTDVFDFGAYMDGTTVVTRSMNFTNNAEIQKLIDANNQLVMINWGTLSDSGDGCAIDWISVTVNYNSTITFSSGANNDTSSLARPNDYVNFTMNATTNDNSLSAYRFSSNFSGSWQNSSWILFSGTTATMWNISTSPTTGTYGWKFFVNSSTGYGNVSEEQYFNFSTRVLQVNWTNANNGYSQINATTCTVGTPCAYQYNASSSENLINVSTNVTCLTNPAGLSCGSLTGGIMYNDTITTYKFINTTTDVTPFYIIGSSTSVNITCKNLTNLGDESTDMGQPNTNAGTSGTMIVSSDSGSDDRSWIKFNVSLNTTPNYLIYVINATLNLYYTSRGVQNPQGRTVQLYNTSDRYLNENIPWDELIITWNNQTTFDTLQDSEIVPSSTGVWMTWSIGEGINTSIPINISLMLKDSLEGSGTTYAVSFKTKEAITEHPFLEICYNETTISGPQNPQSIGSLSDTQYYLLNYTINATDNKDYKLIFNFTSSNAPNPPENLTAPAYITNTSGIPGITISVSLSSSLQNGVLYGLVERGTNGNSAINNTNCDGGTCYYFVLDGSSTTNAQFHNKLTTDITCTGGICTYYVSGSNTSSSLGFGTNAVFDSTDYIKITNCLSISSGNNCWSKYYLDVSSDVSSGTYGGNDKYSWCANATTGSTSC